MNITVYTTKVCPYCDSAKRLLTQRGLAYQEVDLTSDHDLRLRLSAENGGWRTVPMIFVGQRFIGGYDDLSALDKSGELARMVRGEG